MEAPKAEKPAVHQDWDRAFTRTSGWTGGDVAASFVIPGERVLWVFGDSFIGEVEDGKHVRTTLVNNAIAVHAFTDAIAPKPEDVEFFWGPEDEAGKPTAWVRPEEGSAAWYWPTGGGVALPDKEGGSDLALFLIEIGKTGGPDSALAFEVKGNALVMVENPEAPALEWTRSVAAVPESLTRRHELEAEIPIEWGLEAWAEESGRVLVYGVESLPSGRKDLLLAEASAERFLDFAAWKFFSGSRFESSIENVRPVFINVSSEVSLDRVPGRCGREVFIMIYSEPFLGHRVFSRLARRPEGPWSEPRDIFAVEEIQRHESYFTYAAKGHAALSAPGTLLVSYIVNSNDFFTLASDASIYRPRFISVPLSELGLRGAK